jgi:hypothetical protein
VVAEAPAAPVVPKTKKEIEAEKKALAKAEKDAAAA